MRNKALIVFGGLVLVMFFVGANPTSAFWPFSAFGNGKVKGDRAVSIQGTPSGFFQSVARKLGVKNEEGPKTDVEHTIDKLISSGKLTSAQSVELLARMKAIKAKRDELKALEKDLLKWLKDNNLQAGSSEKIDR